MWIMGLDAIWCGGRCLRQIRPAIATVSVINVPLEHVVETASSEATIKVSALALRLSFHK